MSFSEMSPVRHIPAGTIKCPPPILLSWLMALLMASVLRVTPSPTAPKSARFTLLSGMEGRVGTGISVGRFS